MKKQYVSLSLFLSALLWNGWVLASLIYPYGIWSKMEISELAIRAQPWSTVFRSLDGLSALFMIVAATGLLIMYSRKRLKVWFAIAACLLASIGLLTFSDISHSLDCVQYQHPECSAKIEKHLVSRNDNLHNLESRITSYASILLALSIVVLAWLYSPSLALKLASMGLVIGILWTLSVLSETGDLFIYGINDRFWNLLVAGDFLLIAILLDKRIYDRPQS